MRLPRAELKKARIEIIPMIDAIFFLLVFFMMSSLSMVQLSSRRVNLPESRSAQKKPSDKKIVVTISKEGELYLGDDQIKEAQLLPQLSAKMREAPDTTVILNCDKQQQLAKFVRVFDLIKQANAGTVMIATSPKGANEVPGQAAPEAGAEAGAEQAKS